MVVAGSSGGRVDFSRLGREVNESYRKSIRRFIALAQNHDKSGGFR
jgi:hypothetical protein